jgi:cyclopropane fatty-acyl-phospholipid synthase-like methyltransferase
MYESATDKILKFWNGRAELGTIAGTNDFILSRIERDFICESIAPNSRVLDLGCGNATSLLQLVRQHNCHGVGVDFSLAMVQESQSAVERAGYTDKLEIQQHTLPPVPTRFGRFDTVYSQRCLINLTSTDDQRYAVQSVAEILEPGGVYIMIECSIEGSERTNLIRTQIGLDRIEPPWHNLFMHEGEVATWGTRALRLEKMIHISSTYHMLSRVVYAKLAADKGEALHYDSDINLLAAKLPRDIGEFGPVKAWIWRKQG